MTGVRHIPVMMREVVDALQPRDGGRYLDGTFGAGGYTAAMLDRADCQVFAIDRDPDAIAAGRVLAERYAPRLHLIEGRFGGGIRVFGLADDGVDYVHEGPHGRSIPRSVVEQVEALRARVVAGEIRVPETP